MNTLILVMGLPGSGKTTFARDHIKSDYVFAADDYFYGDGMEYNFDPSKLKEAHAQCYSRTEEQLKRVQRLAMLGKIRRTPGVRVVVTNTFTQKWERDPYINLAREYNCQLFIVDLYDGGLTDEELVERNVHGVPVEAIVRMRARYERHSFTQLS